MIQRFYKKADKWCKVIIVAPDGRFQGEPIEGGLTPKTAEFEAKRMSDLGMLVQIFTANG